MKKFLAVTCLLILAAPAFAAHNIQYVPGDRFLRMVDTIIGETVEVFAPVKVFDEFVDSGVAGTPASPTYSSFTFAAVNGGTFTISAATGGVGLIYSGEAYDDDCDLAGPLIWYASKNCAMEARVQISDPSCAINVGFSDAQGETADLIACTYSGTTLTSTASDCALFVVDASATTDNIYCVAVDSDTDGTVTDTTTAFAEDTWYTFLVTTNSDGDCAFYLNGIRIYEQSSGISPEAPLCPYIGLVSLRTDSEPVTMQIDYVRRWQSR